MMPNAGCDRTFQWSTVLWLVRLTIALEVSDLAVAAPTLDAVRRRRAEIGGSVSMKGCTTFSASDRTRNEIGRAHV